MPCLPGKCLPPVQMMHFLVISFNEISLGKSGKLHPVGIFLAARIANDI